MNGVIDGVRGAPWVVMNSDDVQGSYLLLSFGTLATAVYKAFEKDPDNANVKRTIAAGLPNAVVFHPRLPKDVIIFLRDLHNKFHEGSSISFVEVLQMVHDADCDWKSHCVKCAACF